MNSFFNKVSAEKRPVDVTFIDVALSRQSKRVCFALDLRNVDSDAARLLGASKYVSRNGVFFLQADYKEYYVSQRNGVFLLLNR